MYCSIQFNSIQFNSIQFNSIQFNSIQFNSIQFNSIQFNLIQFNSIKFYSVPLHQNIQFYLDLMKCNTGVTSMRTYICCCSLSPTLLLTRSSACLRRSMTLCLRSAALSSSILLCSMRALEVEIEVGGSGGPVSVPRQLR